MKTLKKPFCELFTNVVEGENLYQVNPAAVINVTEWDSDEEGSKYLQKSHPDYVFRKEILSDLTMFMSAPMGDSLFLSGPTGSGKTSLITEFCARTGRPVISVTCSGRTEIRDWIGCQTIQKDGSIGYQLGSLAIAVKHGFVFIANELDLVDPEEASSLNDILEGRDLVLPTGEVISQNPNFRFVATGNTTGMGDNLCNYRGTQQQNIAALDRYRFLAVDYPPVLAEEMILKGVKIPEEIKEGMIKVANDIRNLFKSGRVQTVVSTRGLLRWAYLTQQYQMARHLSPILKGLEVAILGKTNDEDREVFCQHLALHFPEGCTPEEIKAFQERKI